MLLIFGLFSFFFIHPVRGADKCPDNSIFYGIVYGVPEAGCCHYAKPLSIICDPIFSKRKHCEELGATKIDDMGLLGGAKKCAKLCQTNENCTIWTFIPEKRIGGETMPSTCTLVAEPLDCAPASCAIDHAATGRKDCSGQGLESKEERYDPQRDLSLVAKDYVDYPICESPSKNPVVTGLLQAGLLVTNEGCRYPIWDYDGSAQNCVQGSWVVIVGGSNAVLIAAQMANLLTNKRSTIDPGRGMVGSASIVDLVIETNVRDPNAMNVNYEVGTIVHSNYELFNRRVRWSTIADQFKGAVAKAPAYKPTLTRVTLFVGQFWDNVEDAIDFVRNDPQWGKVPASLVTQISQWYQMATYGGNHERDDINYDGEKQMQNAFRRHLKSAINNQLESWCGPDGPAALRGCSLTSNSFTQGQSRGVEAVNRIMQQEIEASSLSHTTQLRFVDIWDIGGAAGMSESMDYHSSPVVMVWFWQVQFAQMCPAVKVPPSPKPLVRFTGSCFAGQAMWSLCPECQEMGRCFALWMCAHAAICNVETFTYEEVMTSGKSTFSCTSGATGGGRRLAGSDSFQVTFQSADATANKQEAPCGRLSCDTSLQWVPVVISVALAVILLSVYIVLQYKWSKEKSKEAPKATATVKESETADPEQPPASNPGADVNPTNEVDNVNPVLPFENSGEGLKGEGSKSVNEAKEAPKEAAKLPVIAQERFPLGLARFLASMHVVVGHMWQRGAVGDVWFYAWGFTWVPWFFMLSGFVLFHSEARKPTKEFNCKEQLKYFAKRTVAIYPLYAFVLPFAWIIDWDRDAVPSAGYIISQIWLVQSWVPSLTEFGFQYMSHCWFLSCMVIYWMLFQPLAWAVNRMGLATVSILTAVLCLLPWLMLIIPSATGDVDWYRDHKWKQTDDATDYWVIFFKFHPVSYLHVFVIGMLIQKWRLLVADRPGLSKCLRWPLEALAPLAYVILCCIFAIKEISIDDSKHTWGHKLTARLSILLPLQGAILLGLSGLPKAPMPLIGKAAMWLEPLADYSYGVYICHMLCYSLWPTERDVNGWYFVFVVATAIVIVLLVQKPIQPWWRKNPGKTVLIPLLLTVLLPCLTLIDSPEQKAIASDIVPETIDKGPGMQDVRLPFANAAEHGDLMNPSVLVVNNQMVAVARRHSRSYEQRIGEYEGQPATIQDEIWNSDIVFGTGKLQVDRRLVEAAGEGSALEKWANGQPPVDNKIQVNVWTGLVTPSLEAWNDLCVKTTWIPENKTLLRLVRTGPEDPKIFEHDSSMAIAFSSLPPLGANGCGADPKQFPLGNVHQMYLAAGVDPQQPEKAVVGNRMSCQFKRLDEKNWIPFEKGGMLHFVYEPQPHKIMVARADGQCAEGFRTNFLPLQRLQQEKPHFKIRGNAQAVYVNDPKVTANLPAAHYLAIMHIYDMQTGRYSHFAYRFSANPPFEILQISEELPIESLRPSAGGTAMAFVSGLALDGRAVMISYGAGDRDARALVMTLERLDALFPCCNQPCVPGSFFRTATVGHWGKHQRGDFNYSHGQECIADGSSKGTLVNDLTKDKKLSVMCCSPHQKAKRECDLCDGGMVMLDDIAGEGCFDGDTKVGGNCVDDDLEKCKEHGGTEIREFTCKQVEDFLHQNSAACKEGIKMAFGSRCCAGGVDAVSRRRQKAPNARKGKRLLATGTASAAQLHDLLMSPRLAQHPQERRLKDTCQICKVGVLARNTEAGRDKGRPYSCQEAQNFLIAEDDEDVCRAYVPVWEGPCCLNEWNSGCRSESEVSYIHGCRDNWQCTESPDCHRDRNSPHGCHDGKCYAGKADERCEDKQNGFDLRDGGWCWDRRRDVECSPISGEEVHEQEAQSWGPKDPAPGIFIFEYYDARQTDWTCKGKPLAKMGLDFSEKACTKYTSPDGPLSSSYVKLVQCNGNKIVLNEICNEDCSECEFNNVEFYSDKCMNMDSDYSRRIGIEEGQELTYIARDMSCPCNSICKPRYKMNESLVAGSEDGKDYTCGETPDLLKETNMDGNPYAMCDAKKANNWEEKCCYKEVLPPGVARLKIFGDPKSDCTGDDALQWTSTFTEDCVTYPDNIQRVLPETRGAYMRLVACEQDKGVLTVGHICKSGCSFCETTERYEMGKCTISAGGQQKVVLENFECPCHDICKAGSQLQPRNLLKEGHSCADSQNWMRDENTNEKCAMIEKDDNIHKTCCNGDSTGTSPAPTPSRDTDTGGSSDRRLKTFVPRPSVPLAISKAVLENKARRLSELCKGGATFEAAAAHCENLGKELCSSDMIKEGWGQGQCPAADSALVWTVDPCVPGAAFPKAEYKEW